MGIMGKLRFGFNPQVLWLHVAPKLRNNNAKAYCTIQNFGEIAHRTKIGKEYFGECPK